MPLHVFRRPMAREKKNILAEDLSRRSPLLLLPGKPALP